jgi:hypothetical protein
MSGRPRTRAPGKKSSSNPTTRPRRRQINSQTAYPRGGEERACERASEARRHRIRRCGQKVQSAERRRLRFCPPAPFHRGRQNRENTPKKDPQPVSHGPQCRASAGESPFPPGSGGLAAFSAGRRSHGAGGEKQGRRKKAMQQATIQLYGDVSSNLSLRVDECRNPLFLSEARRNEKPRPEKSKNSHQLRMYRRNRHDRMILSVRM